MPGNRDFQRGDIWGDGVDDNPRTFEVGREDGSNDMVMTNRARRKTEDETKEKRLAATVAPMIEEKQLVLLHVNCRSIYNKTLDF